MGGSLSSVWLRSHQHGKRTVTRTANQVIRDPGRTVADRMCGRVGVNRWPAAGSSTPLRNELSADTLPHVSSEDTESMVEDAQNAISDVGQ